ncbi:MAG: bifunctional phosphoribosylaminoimidazolecarboxamide formyltransferase/IMP cyclohydrolase [Promethearchaeota archaeon]
MKRIERAIVSVFDKKDMLDFVKVLVNEFDVEILSTGGTGTLLKENGINFQKISEFTESPELFDGRIKTLHPKIEGGLLYRRHMQKDIDEATKYNIKPIDMVVCNLYQFKEAIEKPGTNIEEALEMIDIGGPTMIRSAAKNFPDVIVVPGPEHYSNIIDELRNNNGEISEKTRLYLAQKVFSIMADYNGTIANYLQHYYNPGAILPETITKVYTKVQDCRYGENWDQSAAYYRDLSVKLGLHNFRQLGGKEISFNNFLDIDSCVQMLLDFDKENYVTAILKHTSPNGIAIDKKDQLRCVQMAFKCDPMSAFGGVWGVNKELTVDVADFIINREKILTDVILAPSFDPEALEILKQKKNIRILEIGDFLEHKKEIYRNLELRSVLGGVLIQEYDNKSIIKEWNVVSKKKVTEREKEALIFAYRVSKWAKSNSACFAQENKDGFFTIGIGAGQQSRVHVVKLAAQKAIEFGHEEELKDSVMGTDSFMPFPDALEAAVKVGTKAIIHPGGSINDESVISRADELGCALVFCGKRVFRH